MRLCKRLLIVLLVIAAALTGCSGADASWAYRSGDQTPPIGVYVFYLIDAATAAENAYHEQHADDENNAHPPYAALLNETMPDGQSFAAFMVDEAAGSMREHIAVERKFAEMGLSLTEAEWSYAQSTANSVWTGNQALMEDSGIAESSIRLAYENGMKKQAIFNALYQSGGSNAVSDSELKSAFEKTYAKVDYLLFSKTVEGGEEAAKSEADAYLGRLKGGEELYDLAYEQSKAAAGDSEEVAAPAEGSQTMILAEAYKGSYYSDELVDTALAAAVGEPVLAEDINFYYVIVRKSMLENEVDFLSYRDQVLIELKSDEFEETVAGWAENVQLESNQAALNKFTPKRLKLD